MKKTTIILLLLILSSCHYINNGIIVEIKKTTQTPIYNVTFSSDKNTKLEFNIIEPNKSIKAFLDMKNNEKRDGQYTLKFNCENNNKVEMTNGYYSNAQSLDSKITYKISKDTTLVDFSNIPY
ncbi:hypothetical protein [Wenyingzhuangia sp. IMCC45467]